MSYQNKPLAVVGDNQENQAGNDADMDGFMPAASEARKGHVHKLMVCITAWYFFCIHFFPSQTWLLLYHKVAMPVIACIMCSEYTRMHSQQNGTAYFKLPHC